MIKYLNRLLIPGLIIAFMQIMSFLYAGYSGNTIDQQEARISFKSINLVVGNRILLGEICDLNISDSKMKKSLAQISIGIAPPPGESIEITLISIKKKIISAGFSKLVPYVIGPKVIRVETAQREIDKAFLHEDLAMNFHCICSRWS